MPCGNPHVYQSTGTLALLSAPDQYPSASERADAVEQQCRPAIPTGIDDVDVTGLWDYESYFTPGLDITAPCFFYDPDLTPLPAR